ncbi:MAG: hypothetical protein ACXWHI_09390 [Candidatus Aminicenantales bacterium]
MVDRKNSSVEKSVHRTFLQGKRFAYSGSEGFKKEVLGILEKMDSEPRKGAAMVRNRITTLQHSELWRDALTRFMSEKPIPARPAWTRLVDEWLTRPTSADKA